MSYFDVTFSDLKSKDNRPILCCAVMALAGLLITFPYAYYSLLKLVFVATLIWLGLRHKVFRKTFLISSQGLILILALFLYNPIVQIHLGNRWGWLILNAGTVLYMLWLANLNRRQPNAD
jgi:hypothetical protein